MHLLFDWCRGGTSNLARLLKELDSALSLQLASPIIDWVEVRHLESQRSKVRLQEEVYWKQKSRIKWLESGDPNTSFFHISVTATRKRNFIGDLQDVEGNVISSEKDKGILAASYFQHLFTSEHDGSQEAVSEIGIPSVIKAATNQDLLASVKEEEIRQAVFATGLHQAPGPDGFTGLFFQRYWEIIKFDVISAVKDFFRRGHMLRGFNHTWLTLIPTVAEVTSMTQVRPIGLCTVFYKSISKIIAARLAIILPDLVNPAQNRFVRGRCITDNILIAHELIHYLQTYNSVLLNGNPEGYFSLTRGLRQGDPLSPLLFSICSEGLSHLIQLELQRKMLHGIKLNGHCPMITHLRLPMIPWYSFESLDSLWSTFAPSSHDIGF
ncbi:Transposon TX1 uncharacterized 149 kDa protein [Linum perenne]